MLAELEAAATGDAAPVDLSSRLAFGQQPERVRARRMPGEQPVRRSCGRSAMAATERCRLVTCGTGLVRRRSAPRQGAAFRAQGQPVPAGSGARTQLKALVVARRARQLLARRRRADADDAAPGRHPQARLASRSRATGTPPSHCTAALATARAGPASSATRTRWCERRLAG